MTEPKEVKSDRIQVWIPIHIQELFERVRMGPDGKQWSRPVLIEKMLKSFIAHNPGCLNDAPPVEGTADHE